MESLNHSSSPEKPITREVVVQTLLERGPEDAASKATLEQWKKQNEEEANKINTSEANVRCIIKDVELYIDAKLSKKALNSLEDAFMAAASESDEVYNECIALLERIETMIEYETTENTSQFYNLVNKYT